MNGRNAWTEYVRATAIAETASHDKRKNGRRNCVAWTWLRKVGEWSPIGTFKAGTSSQFSEVPPIFMKLVIQGQSLADYMRGYMRRVRCSSTRFMVIWQNRAMSKYGQFQNRTRELSAIARISRKLFVELSAQEETKALVKWSITHAVRYIIMQSSGSRGPCREILERTSRMRRGQSC